MPEKKENMNITSIQLLIQREQGFGGQGCRIGDTGGGGGGYSCKIFFLAPKSLLYIFNKVL